jgi:cobalt-zinc-cadmium efflux system outer membrane protein
MSGIVSPCRPRLSTRGVAWVLAVVLLALPGCAGRSGLAGRLSVDVPGGTPPEVAAPGQSETIPAWRPGQTVASWFAEPGAAGPAAPQTTRLPGANPAWPPDQTGDAPEAQFAQATEVIPAPDPVDAITGAAASGITLEEAVLEALKCDPTLRAGAEAIHQAEADCETSRLPPNPTLAINGTYLPLRPFTAAAPGGPPELDVIAGYPVDWFLFGKRAAAIGSAKLGVCVSTADYADLVRQRVSGAIAAFYDVLEARSMLDLAREDLASQKRVEGITQQQVRLGGAGSIEVDRIRISLLAGQREVCDRETALVTAKAKLLAALGRCNAAPTFDVKGSLEIPQAATPPQTEEAIWMAEQNRPDIASLRRQIEKAQGDIRVQKSIAYPSITPSAGYTDQYQSSQGSPDAQSMSVSIVATVPLFDRNQGNIHKAQSTATQAALNLQAQLAQLHAEIKQAVAEFESAKDDATSTGPEQFRTARSVRDRTEAGYRAGGKTLLEVIDAETAYRDTHRTYILAQSSYWHTLHRLNAAIGKQVLR